MRERFDELWGGYDSKIDSEGLDKKMLDFIEQELKKEREEIVEIVRNSRTVEETLGIGIREDQARTQAIVDILSKLLKTEYDKQ